MQKIIVTRVESVSSPQNAPKGFSQNLKALRMKSAPKGAYRVIPDRERRRHGMRNRG